VIAILLVACSADVSGPATTMDGGARPDAHVARDDGGTRDGGATRSDAGEVDPSCPPGAVFCEDFEAGLERWTVNGEGVALETANGADGTQSLRVRMGAAFGIAGAQTARLDVPIAAPDDRLYARWFMRFADMRLPGYHPNFVTVIGPEYDPGEGWLYPSLSFGSFGGSLSINAFGRGLDGGKLWEEPGVEFSTTGDSTPDGEHHLRSGEWFCVELALYGDHQSADDTEHPAEENRVFIEGVEIPELYGNDERWGPWGAAEHWSPGYDGSTWTFGIAGIYPEMESLEIWFDRIVFSNTPIGCE
jgi:hypothetical protein